MMAAKLRSTDMKYRIENQEEIAFCYYISRKCPWNGMLWMFLPIQIKTGKAVVAFHYYHLERPLRNQLIGRFNS